MLKTIAKIAVASLCSSLHTPLLADPIKIGVAGPFSGPYVAAGDQQWLGASQAVSDINKKGGINGDKLILIPADDACDIKKAENIAKNFVNENEVKAIIGHNCSSTSIAASKIYAQANMVMITPASTAPILTEQGFPTIFRTCGRNDMQAETAVAFISKKLKAKKMAVIYDDTTYGQDLAKNIKLFSQRHNIEVLLFQKAPNASQDYLALIEQLSTLHPDLIYFGGLHTNAGILLKHFRENAINSIFMGGDGLASPDFVQAAGGPINVNKVYMTFFKDPSMISEAKNIVKKFEDKRIDSTGYALNAYAAVQAIADGLKHTSQTNSSLGDWLHQNKVDSVIGTLEWNKNGDLTSAPFVVYQWNEDGEYSPY